MEGKAPFCLFFSTFFFRAMKFFFFPSSRRIKSDQRAYQNDLEEGFEDMKKKLWPFISDGSSESFKR